MPLLVGPPGVVGIDARPIECGVGVLVVRMPGEAGTGVRTGEVVWAGRGGVDGAWPLAPGEGPLREATERSAVLRTTDDKMQSERGREAKDETSRVAHEGLQWGNGRGSREGAVMGTQHQKELWCAGFVLTCIVWVTVRVRERIAKNTRSLLVGRRARHNLENRHTHIQDCEPRG
jgi:hypothetical protein